MQSQQVSRVLATIKDSRSTRFGYAHPPRISWAEPAQNSEEVSEWVASLNWAVNWRLNGGVESHLVVCSAKLHAAGKFLDEYTERMSVPNLVSLRKWRP